MAKETEKYKQSQKKIPKSGISEAIDLERKWAELREAQANLINEVNELMEDSSNILEPPVYINGKLLVSGQFGYHLFGSYDKLLNTIIPLNTQHCTCLITEVTDSTVITETLIDKENMLTQTRRFDKLPLEDVVECKEGTIFNLTIVTKPGSREFIYTPGNPDDIKYFEETLIDTTSLINDLKNDPIFQKGPDVDDGNTF